MSFAEQFLAEATRDHRRSSTSAAIERMADAAGRHARSAADGCSSSASAAARPTRRTRSTTSARSPASRPTRPPTTSRELTARTNDEGWATRLRRLAARSAGCTAEDALLVFSVGGGNLEKNVSPNLVAALQYAKEVGATIIGIVGRDGGYTAQVADACVIVPTVNPDARHAARRGVPGGGLAPAGLASRAEAAQTKWESVTLTDAPSSSTATACSTAPWCATASRIRPRRLDELEILPGRAPRRWRG